MSFFKNSLNPCLASVDIMMRRWQYENATWWGVFIPVCVSMHVFMCMCACVWWRSQIICRLLNQTARQTSSVQIHFIATLLRREEAQYKTWFKVSLTFFHSNFNLLSSTVFLSKISFWLSFYDCLFLPSKLLVSLFYDSICWDKQVKTWDYFSNRKCNINKRWERTCKSESLETN